MTLSQDVSKGYSPFLSSFFAMKANIIVPVA